MRTVSIIGPVLLVGWSVALAGDDLSFERRIEAQRAIERVYYSHQIGTTVPFEQAVPRELLEKKVRTCLTQSMALEEFWGTPITADALRHELERIAANTRFPGRLQEIYAALGHDPILIQETFVRPVLVDRLARSFFAFDEPIHAEARAAAGVLRDDLVRGAIGLHDRNPARSELRVETKSGDDEPRGRHAPDSDGIGELPTIAMTEQEFERWRDEFPSETGAMGPVEENNDSFTVRAVIEEEAGRAVEAIWKVDKTRWDAWWSGVEDSLDERETRVVARELVVLPMPEAKLVVEERSAARLEPCDDDFWDNGSLEHIDDFPEGRRYHTAVWTGSLMVMWGGQGSTDFNSGARYDPLTDSWSATSTDGAPSARREHTAIWTGSEMIVWGGRSGGSSITNTGSRYDPLSDTWTVTSTTDAASARTLQTAVWTGSEMIVWGGWDFNLPNTGGRYDPVTDTWTATSTVGAPVGRYEHTAVWTGSRMVIWGGADDFASSYNTGGRYDPATDSWTPTSMVSVPQERAKHSAVWTGNRMVVWGGDWSPIIIGARNTGGRYDPVADTWTATSTAGAPSSRFLHTAVWTGSRMVVWGGGSNTGGRYDPDTDAWVPTAVTGAPASRSWHTAIWTGDLMIVWGGSSNTNTGGRYDPVADSWTPTSFSESPSHAGLGASAVWTGTSMIVWGGRDGNTSVGTGSRYDPLTDTWTPIATIGAPIERSLHSAIWTGSHMVVWGGAFGSSYANTFFSGGRYDPIADSWAPTSTISAPAGRADHTAVWTGSRMIVWGGRDSSSYFNNGGVYNPSTDIWTGISVVGSPTARSEHSAVWTGTRMIVWGGQISLSALGSGGSYDPQLDAWSTLSMIDAPQPAREHTAVWTGTRMIVWGGRDSSSYLNTGGGYDPLTDMWLPTSMTSAPSGRTSHTAIWTGESMIVWGGFLVPQGASQATLLDTGGIYDPAADLWYPTTMLEAPSPNAGHAAVWTGTEMIVWSGDGGRYHPPDADGDGMSLCDGDCDDAEGSVYAGAPDLCDGLNNDCGHPSWPALAGSVEMDDDGDGLSECSGDCDDTDSAAWAVPGTVPNLTFTDQSTMTWNSPVPLGGTSPLYDTVRAQLPDGFAWSLMCVEEGEAGTTSSDAALPALGEVAYYLVRAQNVCGTGGVGAASDGTPRVAASCP